MRITGFWVESLESHSTIRISSGVSFLSELLSVYVPVGDLSSITAFKYDSLSSIVVSLAKASTSKDIMLLDFSVLEIGGFVCS